MSTFAAIVLALALNQTATPTSADPDGERAIRAIVAEQDRAWNNGDAAGYASAIAPDVAFTNIFGVVLFGREAFVERQVEILRTFFKGTVKAQTIRRIRFITADVAIVNIDNEVRGVRSLPSGIAVPPDGVVRTQLLQVYVRREGRWWIEAFHNVDIKAPGR